MGFRVLCDAFMLCEGAWQSTRPWIVPNLDLREPSMPSPTNRRARDPGKHCGFTTHDGDHHSDKTPLLSSTVSLYPSGSLQPCPFRFGDRDPIGGDPPPIHPWDPDLVRRPWSQNCPSTTPCQSFGPRDTSPTSKIASAAVGRCPLCCDSKLIAWDGRARWFARAPTRKPRARLATRHLLAETIESGGGAVCGHWFGDVRRQGGDGEGETSE